MRTKEQIFTFIERPGVVAVVRAKSAEQVLPLSEALINAGFRAIEITMTTPNALDGIRQASSRFSSVASIGVGTVLNAETARRAIDAGAEFIVSPITKPEIAQVASAAARPVMLGAYTATEAQLAFDAGTDYVKLFPADSLGPAYIKALRAPLPHLRIVPTGGVSLDNIFEFFAAGCPAVGLGSSLISKSVLEKNDWTTLTKVAREFVGAAELARK
ncbi:MAG TPA: bifunctional 4-hydroxy-2-oxoglutarate aldolase/2-dehydro-3-deoxy-phosphogluconate aldolase [Verrucomicrobiae bacterium]